MPINYQCSALPFMGALCAFCMYQYIVKIVSVFSHQLSLYCLFNNFIKLAPCAFCMNQYLTKTVSAFAYQLSMYCLISLPIKWTISAFCMHPILSVWRSRAICYAVDPLSLHWFYAYLPMYKRGFAINLVKLSHFTICSFTDSLIYLFSMGFCLNM